MGRGVTQNLGGDVCDIRPGDKSANCHRRPPVVDDPELVGEMGKQVGIEANPVGCNFILPADRGFGVGMIPPEGGRRSDRHRKNDIDEGVDSVARGQFDERAVLETWRNLFSSGDHEQHVNPSAERLCTESPRHPRSPATTTRDPAIDGAPSRHPAPVWGWGDRQAGSATRRPDVSGRTGDRERPPQVVPR
jgi:hypothetical protein